MHWWLWQHERTERSRDEDGRVHNRWDSSPWHDQRSQRYLRRNERALGILILVNASVHWKAKI